MKRLTQTVPIVLATMLVSCESSAPDQAEYTVVDSAGVRIVESVTPAWDSGAVRIEAEPYVRIGREEEGPYQFSHIPSAALLDDGRIAVADFISQEVRLFDSSGEHLKTFGGVGDGPTEFRGVTKVMDYPGGSLAAFDARQYRTTIFSTASSGSRTIPNPVEGNFTVFGHVESGHFLLSEAGSSYRPDLTPGLQWVPTDIVAVDSEDGSARVIASLPNQLRRAEADVNAPMSTPSMYAVKAATDAGFYWGTTDRYEIGFYDVEGTLQRILRRPVEPRLVDASMIDEHIETQLEWVRQSEGGQAVPRYRAQFEEQEYGEYRPLFRSAFADRDARLWLGSSEWPADRPSRTWSVFSTEGRWLGDLQAPDGVRVMDAAGDRVLAVWWDDFDVPYVQLHRLIGASAESPGVGSR